MTIDMSYLPAEEWAFIMRMTKAEAIEFGQLIRRHLDRGMLVREAVGASLLVWCGGRADACRVHHEAAAPAEATL